jgi:3-isopropylmalate dehydrogenase
VRDTTAACKIAVLAGDGIGPEVVAEAVKVLQALRSDRFEFELREAPVGASAYLLAGHPLPEPTLQVALGCDAVLFGAVGDPRFDHLEASLRPERAILGLRRGLGLFASLKQVSIPTDLADLSPLRAERVAGVDLLVVRELNGDVYTGQPRGVRAAPDGPFAGEREGFDTMRYADGEVRRIAHIAFRAARHRSGRLCNVDKANVLATSRVWREVVIDVARDYPDVTLTHLYADNAAMQLIANPKSFDVMLAGNLFGDILSDAASVLTGSIGLPASALLGDGMRGMYEAGHGSALDIAGRDIANPLACIRAAALMLRHSFDRDDLARHIEDAVTRMLRSGWRTADIRTTGTRCVGTRAMGDAVVDALDG